MKDFRFWLNGQRGTLVALVIFILMFAVYLSNHPAILNNGYTVQGVGNVVQTAANKGILLALIAIAQTFVVLTAGIDLSVGAIFILCNVVASFVVVTNLGAAWGIDLGPVLGPAVGIVIVLAVGALCGALNGAIVIFGRLQPIVTTIATSAVFFGIALFMRPQPGSTPEFAKALGKFMLGKFGGVIPASMVFLLVVVLLIWLPFRWSTLGRATYAVGSSESASYMSGVPVRRAKFLAYVLAGLFSGLGGLYLTFVTSSGQADQAAAGGYTLNSIAAVVLGGVSLFGGRGSAVGAIFGALAFLTIKDLLFVFNFDPLWQPLFQGVVLALAVAIGSARLFQVRNRLEVFG
ncbi:MAG TPA: ABC transporter permease [Devosia sp.]|nr:ABC transporter permease [Devosia sp.]